MDQIGLFVPKIKTITSEVYTDNVNYSFTILEFDPPDLDKAEQKWASRLVTMEPFGLNIQKPCGVADKMITMSKKAAHSRRM